jgi:hypothetical protein
MKFTITQSPFNTKNKTIGEIRFISGFPCPFGLSAVDAHAIIGFLTSVPSVWIPKSKAMPDCDLKSEEHQLAAMNSLDCIGYHAEMIQ